MGYRRWSSHWASLATPRIFCIDSDPGTCRGTIPELPISLVSYYIWLPSAMSKSQGSCSWQGALGCQQLLTGETHWPKIRKLACLAEGPTSPVSCHHHSLYTAPLQERWSVIQEKKSGVRKYKWSYGCSFTSLWVVFLRTALLSGGTFRNGLFHGTLESYRRLWGWLAGWKSGVCC